MATAPDLRSLLQPDKYKWEGEPPATKAAIQNLLAFSPYALPQAYLDFLGLSDGGTAELSVFPSYLRIWSAELVISNNEGYEVQENAPGFLAIGDDGGPDIVGFDFRPDGNAAIKALLFVPMEWESSMDVATDFEAMMRAMMPK